MLWIALVAPFLVLAQGVDQPPSTAGNNGSAPGQESVESAPGLAWFGLVLVGSVVFGGLLLALLMRQDRLDGKRPPG